MVILINPLCYIDHFINNSHNNFNLIMYHYNMHIHHLTIINYYILLHPHKYLHILLLLQLLLHYFHLHFIFLYLVFHIILLQQHVSFHLFFFIQLRNHFQLHYHHHKQFNWVHFSLNFSNESFQVIKLIIS